jgi:hypothetical protein
MPVAMTRFPYTEFLFFIYSFADLFFSVLQFSSFNISSPVFLDQANKRFPAMDDYSIDNTQDIGKGLLEKHTPPIYGRKSASGHKNHAAKKQQQINQII